MQGLYKTLLRRYVKIEHLVRNTKNSGPVSGGCCSFLINICLLPFQRYTFLNFKRQNTCVLQIMVEIKALPLKILTISTSIPMSMHLKGPDLFSKQQMKFRASSVVHKLLNHLCMDFVAAVHVNIETERCAIAIT